MKRGAVIFYVTSVRKISHIEWGPAKDWENATRSQFINPNNTELLNLVKGLKKQSDVQQAELTLLRKALEDTLEQTESYQAPTYDEEFGTLYRSTESLTEQISALKNTSLLKQPQQMLNRIEQASTEKLRAAIDAFSRAKKEADQMSLKLNELITSARARDTQNWLLVTAFILGISVGFFDHHFWIALLHK